MKQSIAVIAACFLTACTSMPGSGPTTDAVIGNSAEETHQSSYVLVDINTAVLDVLERESNSSLRATFGSEASPAQGTIEPGDRLVIDIWETGTAKLFSSGTTAQAQLTPLPEQVVANDGTLLVPYLGRLKVDGMAPPEAQFLIQQRLRKIASDPQVMISVTRNLSDVVTVSGDDIHGALIPLSSRNDRVLDIIAQAGGIQSPTYAALVQVIRNERTATLPLQKVVQDPQENIQLHPGDTLVISKNPEYFTALGATGKSMQVAFGAPQVNLIEALGLSGGLLDERADTRGVFVFRYESPEVARQLCRDCKFLERASQIPVVFHFDMNQAQSLFDAQAFQMNHRDLLYIANASEVQVAKVLAIIRDFMSPILTGAVLDRAINQK